VRSDSVITAMPLSDGRKIVVCDGHIRSFFSGR
jgi:hypothetical protein